MGRCPNAGAEGQRAERHQAVRPSLTTLRRSGEGSDVAKKRETVETSAGGEDQNHERGQRKIPEVIARPADKAEDADPLDEDPL